MDLMAIWSLPDEESRLAAPSGPGPNSPTCHRCHFPPKFAACSVTPHPRTLQLFSPEPARAIVDCPIPRALTRTVALEDL